MSSVTHKHKKGQKSTSKEQSNSSISESRYDTLFTTELPVSRSSRGNSKTNRQSRGRSSSSSSYRNMTPKDGTPIFIIAIIDNKAKEIGLAAMNLKSSTVFLSQFVENSSTTFNNVCNMLHIYSPCVEVVLPNTQENTTLANIIKHQFPGIQLTFIPRKLFNETKGHISIKQLAIKESASIELEVMKKYLCVSSATALINYVEYIQNVSFSSQSIRFWYKPLTGHLLLDASSIVNLELVLNLKTGKKADTLLSVLDHTKTPMGARLLRSSILQPLTDQTTIETRLDCVQEILKNEQGFFDVANALKGLVDLDLLLTQFCQRSKKINSRAGQTIIMNIIWLKHILEQTAELEAILGEYENPLLRTICSNMQNKELEEISQEINKIINVDFTATRNALAMQNQKIYAIKTGINGLLDVSRRQYQDIIEDLHEMVNRYKVQTGIASIKLQYNIRRGYYLSYDAKVTLSPDTKKLFIQSTKYTKKVTCSTEELNSMNQKIKDIIDEIYLLTDVIVDELVSTILERMNSLHKLSESLALLDMMFSFANLVTLGGEYVRPQITKTGPIAIKSGRHPILEKKNANGFFVPNDTYIADSSNLQILTGANMSGKSTYVRQIALLTIMAHMGSFIPAKFASFRIVDKLFTRIGTDDNMETNSGTFMVEMNEVAYIIQNVSNKSLVLIDELGRGTSNIEGNSITWSICEYLLSTQAYVILVTHYMQLVELEFLYPNVKNYHCMVSTNEGTLHFAYNIGEGSCNEDNYGLKLAKMLGLPKEIVSHAQEICYTLAMERKKKAETNQSNSQQVQFLRTCYQMAHRLICLKNSSLDEQSLSKFLKGMKETYQEIFEKIKKIELEDEIIDDKGEEEVIIKENIISTSKEILETAEKQKREAENEKKHYECNKSDNKQYELETITTVASEKKVCEELATTEMKNKEDIVKGLENFLHSDSEPNLSPPICSVFCPKT